MLSEFHKSPRCFW